MADPQMAEYLAPGVYVEEIPAAARPIEGVATSTAGFVGMAERVPAQVTRVDGLAEYEQRFGRVHRIGQQHVCHLWNLVAEDTREGQVYLRLLGKLDRTTNRRTYLAILNNLALAQHALGQTDDALRTLLAALPLTR